MKRTFRVTAQEVNWYDFTLEIETDEDMTEDDIQFMAEDKAQDVMFSKDPVRWDFEDFYVREVK